MPNVKRALIIIIDYVNHLMIQFVHIFNANKIIKKLIKTSKIESITQQ